MWLSIVGRGGTEYYMTCVELGTLFMVLACVELRLFEELSMVGHTPRMDSFTQNPHLRVIYPHILTSLDLLRLRTEPRCQ